MLVTHEPWLVALSLVVAFQGSFVGLSLAVQLRHAVEPRRRLLLAGAALTLALAIWSMHFVGMLAAQLPVSVDFLVLPTLLSFLVCVLVVGIAVFAASNRSLSSLRLGLAAFVMGAGICTMHYLGMYALHASIHMQHNPAYVFASFLIAFNAAGLAIWLLFGLGRRPPVVVSSAVLALAISAMHYIAMAGMSYVPASMTERFPAPSLDPGTLAIIVSCVAFLVSGMFLLALVPPPTTEEKHPREREIHRQPATLTDISEMDPTPSVKASVSQVRAAAGLQAASQLRSGSPSVKRTLPVERDGRKATVNVCDIVAIHADAHYTRLYDGQREFFCPLSISQVEQQLDTKQFSRVHRSHIVNLARVSSFKRSGDGGTIMLDGNNRQSVPVSRSRWSRVRNRLTALAERADLIAPPEAAQ